MNCLKMNESSRTELYLTTLGEVFAGDFNLDREAMEKDFKLNSKERLWPEAPQVI